MSAHITVILALLMSGFCLGMSVMMAAWNKFDGKGPWAQPIFLFFLGISFGVSGVFACLSL